MLIGIGAPIDKDTFKMGVYLKGGVLIGRRALNRIITVHVVGLYMIILASENIDEGRKSDLAITNRFVSSGNITKKSSSLYSSRERVGILMNEEDVSFALNKLPIDLHSHNRYHSQENYLQLLSLTYIKPPPFLY